MTQRLAGAMALIAFTLCLLIGGFSADNTFGTAVTRAMLAMLVTFLVGLIVGRMAERMIEENVSSRAQAAKNVESLEMKSPAGDR